MGASMAKIKRKRCSFYFAPKGKSSRRERKAKGGVHFENTKVRNHASGVGDLPQLAVSGGGFDPQSKKKEDGRRSAVAGKRQCL